MDKKIKKYQTILEAFLKEEAAANHIQGIEYQVIIDEKSGHCQLLQTGWYEKRYIHAVVFHFQVKENGKVWLFANNTDTPIDYEMIKRGIPTSDIVVAFHSESVRALTPFAVA